MDPTKNNWSELRCSRRVYDMTPRY